MKNSYIKEIRGLKQLYKILTVKNKMEDFEKFTGAFLDRQGFHSWWSK